MADACLGLGRAASACVLLVFHSFKSVSTSFSKRCYKLMVAATVSRCAHATAAFIAIIACLAGSSYSQCRCTSRDGYTLDMTHLGIR